MVSDISLESEGTEARLINHTEGAIGLSPVGTQPANWGIQEQICCAVGSHDSNSIVPIGSPNLKEDEAGVNADEVWRKR